MIRSSYKAIFFSPFSRKGGKYHVQEDAEGLVEYALILVLVAIVIIIILSVLGPAIGNVFSQIVNSI